MNFDDLAESVIGAKILMIDISTADEKKLNNTIVTIGKFDGLHKGHEKLLKIMSKMADGRDKVVLTFAATPKDILKHSTIKTIVTDEEKKLLCEQLGIDVYFKMPLTREFLGLTPEEFLKQIIVDKLGASVIVCGPDFGFGKNREGNVEFLKKFEDKYGYKLIVVEKEKYHNKDISSTIIREKISQGCMEEVNDMLDHPYSVIGKVEEGKKIGRSIEFPTANIHPDGSKLLPPRGVYLTKVIVGDKKYDAITNIGVNPTISSKNPTKVESCIFDFDEEIYGEIISVNFYKFIRPEKKFGSVNDLREQIASDIDKCKSILNEKELF